MIIQDLPYTCKYKQEIINSPLQVVMKYWHAFLFIFLYTCGRVPTVTARRDSAKILHSFPNHQEIVLHDIEKPNIFEVDLLCNRNTTIHFLLGQNIRSANKQIQLMLRIDYLPNRCIIAKQDLPPLNKNQSKWSVTFEKSCCDLRGRPVMEKQNIVATVRDAFNLFGFPIPYKFWNQIVPIITICVILSIVWSLDLKQSHKHCIKRYTHPKKQQQKHQQPLKTKKQ